MENIFEFLKRKEVPYSVIVENNFLTKDPSEVRSRTFSIIVCKSDEIKVKEAFFKDQKKIYTLLRELSFKEVEKFMKIINEFEEVLNNEYGKVYERIDKSFKSYYTPFRDKAEMLWENERLRKLEGELSKREVKCREKEKELKLKEQRHESIILS